jgi:GNAT superfamily N-acetyltransferase
MTTESFRPATDADIASQHAVFCRAEGSLRLRHGFSWVDPPLAWFAPMAEHLLSSDPDRCFVAEADGQVVGFSAAFVRDGVWFLAALFIDPDHQGGGIGRRLFELAAGDGPSRRITITDAIQPVSNAMYARYGLVPTTPMLLFEGEPSIDVPPVLEPGEPRPGELTMLDRAGYGFARPVDHEFWSRHRRCTVWRRDGSAVAYAYRALTGSIGPLAGIDQVSAAEALRAELGRVSRASVLIPGTARDIVDVAVAARLRLVAPSGNLLLSRDAPTPHSLAVSNYFLY